MVAERLSMQMIRRWLDTRIVGRHLYVFDEVESTNSVLRDLARSGAAEGTVVLAEAQSGGRGRRGQPWFSPAGVNLYASVLVRERMKIEEAGPFSFAVSLAVSEAIKDLGLSPAIKWPNDVLIGGKKVAGALMEFASRGAAVAYMVLGTGVNVNRSVFTAAYLNHLEAWLLQYRLAGPAPLVAAWRQRDVLTGRRVEVRSPTEAIGGRVLGIDDQGHLLVRTASGDRRVILTEDVRVVD
jgi:BirA family transcriptional regulator, biotin operon repressor / biotin---[acetyl-CoA-carboxylase] ligase